MRLYLSAETNTKATYTPNVITISYTTEDGAKEQLSMDIDGAIDYVKDAFDVRVKGELLPWTYTDNTGEETDLSALKGKEAQFFIKHFNKYLPLADEIIVSLYDEDESDEAEIFSNCEGEYHYIDKNEQTKIIEFAFQVEII